MCLVDDCVFERPQAITAATLPTHAPVTAEFVSGSTEVPGTGAELTQETAGTKAGSDFQSFGTAGTAGTKVSKTGEKATFENLVPTVPLKTVENSSEIREFLELKLKNLSPYGKQLMSQLLPKNKVGATTEVGLVYWLMQRQKQEPRLKQLLFECFGASGSGYADMSNLYKELASTGVFSNDN